MTTNATTTNGVLNLARIYYSNEFLKNMRSDLVYANLISTEDEDVIQDYYGPTIQWTRMPDFSEATTVSELGSVGEQALSTSIVTATLVEKSRTVKISDRLYSFTLIKKINATINRMARSAAVTIDNMIRRKLCNGDYRGTLSGLSLDSYAVLSNLSHSALINSYTYTTGTVAYYHLPYISLSGTGQFPKDIKSTIVTANETVPANFTTASMILTAAKLKYAEAYLKSLNVKPFKDGYFRAVIDTWQAYHLARDPELVNFITYGSNNAMGGNGRIEYMNGEIGAIGRIRLFESTQATNAIWTHSANSSFFSADVAASAWTPTVCTIVGSNCVTMVDHAAVELGSGGMQALKNVKINILGFEPSKSDPNGQYMQISYKITTAVGLLDYTAGLNLLQFYSRNGHA